MESRNIYNIVYAISLVLELIYDSVKSKIIKRLIRTEKVKVKKAQKRIQKYLGELACDAVIDDSFRKSLCEIDDLVK